MAFPAVSDSVSDNGETLATESRVFVIALSTLALAQAALLLVSGSGVARALGVVLALAGLNARIRLLSVLAVAIIINFWIHIVGLTPPFPYRLAHLAILTSYGAIAFAAFCMVLFRISSKAALLVACVPALTFVVAEAASGMLTPTGPIQQLKWIGGTEPHETIGEVNPSYGVMRAVYPDNPRGYFDEGGRPGWLVTLDHPGSAATLERAADRPEFLRVSITRADELTPSHIQLSQPDLNVRAGEQYELRFLARADARRPISYGVSLAHAPWDPLVPFREVTVERNWREFSETMTFSAGDPNAEVRFDLGGSPASVELERVLLRRMPSGEVVKPATAPPHPEYSVTFRFNAFGCRGDDYPVPRPLSRTRILVLGGAPALGVGVHESDTFASRLERLLNAEGRPTEAGYDVINCGAKGYATREDRLFYEQIAAQYEPNLVVLTMGSDDNLSSRDAERLGYGRPPGKYEELFRTFEIIQNLRHPVRPRTIDYAPSLDEVLKLADACKTRNARLVVVVFRNAPLAPPWSDLVLGLSSRLTGTDVPYLDLGQTLLRNHNADDLVVHRLDRNPNEIAHHAAADEIRHFLNGHGL
jgi:hypothetical protein